MVKRFLAALVVLCFVMPSIAGAEFAPQFKESSKGQANLSKSAPMHGKVYNSNAAMGKNATQKQVGKNKQAMERNVSQEKQAHKIMQGTVNE